MLVRSHPTQESKVSVSRSDEPVYLGAYWGDRPESAVVCGDRLARCLSLMTSVSSYLSGWRPKGQTESDALSSASIDGSDLVGLLEAGVNRRDADGTPILELGFRWAAWNGDAGMPVSISLTCGASMARAGVSNAFVLNLPKLSQSGAEEIYDDMERLLWAVVEAWDPDSAVVTSHELRESVGLEARPTAGWLTYLGPDRDAVDMGSDFGAGTLIRASDNWRDLVADRVADIAARLPS